MTHPLLAHRPRLSALDATPRRQRSSVVRNLGDELRRAAELLEHADAGTLSPHLANFVAKASGSLPGPVRDALVALLERLGRRALPHLAATPRAEAGRVFGIELEGLSAEDQAFELARHYARFVANAARFASHLSPGLLHRGPVAVAQAAADAAARRFAPGLKSAAGPLSARPIGQGSPEGAGEPSSLVRSGPPVTGGRLPH